MGNQDRVAVIIPFRDRGIDPLRQANLDMVSDCWEDFGADDILVTDDGRKGKAQFNRSAAYNRGALETDADILIFAEADMIVPFDQVTTAINLARLEPGLVVPFTEYRYLSEQDSENVRTEKARPADCTPEYTMNGGRSIGAINVMSRQTLNSIGQWDIKFEGNWYDDNAHKIAFDICAGPTRWVTGPAFHLFHLPGHDERDGTRAAHLTAEDRAATNRNKMRLARYKRIITDRGPSERVRQAVRDLTTGAR